MLMLQINPLDLPGPQFLIFYIALMIAAAIMARLIKRALVSPRWSSVQQINLDAYEAAYLRGGATEAVDAALAVLVQKQLLNVSKTTRIIKTCAPLPAGAHPFEKAVHQAVGSSGHTINDIRSSPVVELHTARLAERLKQLELIPNDNRWLKARLASTLVMLTVVALGVMKIFVGISRHRPVGFLVILCIIAGLMALSIFNSRSRPARTRLGDQAFRQLQDENAALQMAARTQPNRLAGPDAALAIGLFGMSALAFADNTWTDLRAALRPPPSVSSNWSASNWGNSSCSSSSSSSSSCSSSSCGSSCGGGCGSGCGGCGGG